MFFTVGPPGRGRLGCGPGVTGLPFASTYRPPQPTCGIWSVAWRPRVTQVASPTLSCYTCRMAKTNMKMLRIDATAHHRLRVAAADRQELMSDLASRLIREGLRRVYPEAAETRPVAKDPNE